LTLGLLVDTSLSERRMLGTEQAASHAFFEKVLRPGKDKAFLIHFDHDVELLQDLTSSRESLEKALALLKAPESEEQGNGGGRHGGGGGGRGGGGRRGHGTALYDAIYLASDELMKKQTGRKAVVLLTDGEDSSSKISLAEAIASSQRAETLAYSMRIADEEGGFKRGFSGPGMGGGHGGGWGGQGGGGGRGGNRGGRTERPDGKKILQQISKETGGGYFEVSKKKTIANIFDQIDEELHSQYSIGYTSDRPETDSGFRKIALSVKQKGLTVQAREGYYARTAAASS
jgi:VWFA-related protein